MAEFKPAGRAVHIRGALVEYGTDVLGPIPNIVVFQFNPEEISRTFKLPQAQRPDSEDGEEDSEDEEAHQASSPPVESFQITAHFAAAPKLGTVGPSTPKALAAGIAPQLAALEQMVYPHGEARLAGAVMDAAADALGDDEPATRETPREKLPRILFIWGPTRVLPVIIKSLSFTEQKFDTFLNPVQAEVSIGLSVVRSPGDKLGQGAFDYTQKVKDVHTAMNLTEPLELSLTDVIRF